MDRLTGTDIALSVNVDKIALLRNARGGDTPNLLDCAALCLDAGADGITAHPRPDGRHILPGDIASLAALCRERGAELNVEGNPLADEGLMELLATHKPAQATLVPDDHAQLTSDHGIDLARHGDALRPLVERLRDDGCRVSLFIEPCPDAARRAAAAGARRVELYTGPFAASPGDAALLARYGAAGRAAQDAGLQVNAGHDLSLDNLPSMIAALPGLREVSIGQALVADALRLGLAASVRAYKNALAGAESPAAAQAK